MNLIHFISLQYHSFSQQGLSLLPAANLISLQKVATCFAAPTFFSSFRTPFSENSLTIRKPGAMIQLAKMQMEPFPSRPSFTCSGEMGKMRRNSCVLGHGSHGMIYEWNLLLSSGESAVCDGRGKTSTAMTRFHFFLW